MLFRYRGERRTVGGFAQIGKYGKALQKTAGSTEPGMENMCGYVGTGGKEPFRRAGGTVKGITVEVDEREHGTVLDEKSYESVCGRVPLATESGKRCQTGQKKGGRHGQTEKKGVYFN